MYRYIRAGSDWNSLSGADQMAVEYANQYLNQGMTLEDAVRNACNDVTWGNAEPEYEDEDFYEEEPDYRSVLNYMRLARGEHIQQTTDIECTEELKTYDVYFNGKCYGQVKAKSEEEAYEQYEDVIPPDLFVGVDHHDLPDLIWVEESDGDNIEECNSIQASTSPKKYVLTYRISQVWYENGEEVDRDTWEETRTTRRADNEVMAQAIVENKLEKEYGCHTDVGPWELELNCIDIKER